MEKKEVTAAVNKFTGLVTVNVSPAPDRAQFYRDAEAVLRLPYPGLARRYIAGLCESRAIRETVFGHTPKAYMKARVRELKRELYLECVARGFTSCGLTHIYITLNVEE